MTTMASNRRVFGKFSPVEYNNLKRKAINDIWAFCDLIDFYGGSDTFDPAHEELARFVSSTTERRLILMSRGHFKSTLCSSLYVLWRIYQNPSIRIMVGCALKELATGFVREVKTYLEDPYLQKILWNDRPHYKGKLIPDMDKTGSSRKRGSNVDYSSDDYGGEGETEASDKKILWRANAIQVLRPNTYKEPTVFATSVGTTVTGWHYDLAIFDDIVTFSNSDTPDKAEKILSWVRDIESVINLRNERTGLGDEIITLGTRYYKWDFYGHLMGETIEEEEERTEYLETIESDPLFIFERDIYGNGRTGLYHPDMERVSDRDASTGYLCPKLMNPSKEAKLRRRLKSRRFSSQYLNVVVAKGDMLVSWDDVNFLAPMAAEKVGKHVKLRLGNGDNTFTSKYIAPICVVDPAASLKDKADHTVMLVGGLSDEGELFAIDAVWGHFTPSTMAVKLRELMQKWSLNSCIFETTGTQVAIVNAIKDCWKQQNYNAAIIADIPKGDKKQRILDTLEPILEERNLYLTHIVANSKEVAEQFDLFPAAGTRDDFLDALEKLKRWSKPTSTKRVEKKMSLRAMLPRKVGRYGGIAY